MMLICISLGIGLLILSVYLSNKQQLLLNLVSAPYECGFDPYSTLNNQAIAKFYLVAVLYLLFDLELSILLPISVIIQYSTVYINCINGLIILLFLGFLVEKYCDIISISHFK